MAAKLRRMSSIFSQRRRAIGVRQHHNVLVSTESTQHIAHAEALAQEIGEGFQHLVSHQMPVFVVDLLEAVDVQHRDRKPSVLAISAANRDLELLDNAAVSEEPGEAVLLHEHPQRAAPLGAGRYCRHQLFWGNRLGEEIVASFAERGDLLHAVCLPRKEDDRHTDKRLFLAYHHGQLETCTPRHVYIHQNHVRLELHQLGHDLEGIIDGHRFEARRFETGGMEFGRVGLVVNDENSIGLRFAPSQAIEGLEHVRIVDGFDEIAAATGSHRVEPGFDI